MTPIWFTVYKPIDLLCYLATAISITASTGKSSSVDRLITAIPIRHNSVENLMPIYFYTHGEEPYGCFSNFSRHGFVKDKLWWNTSEHYFQAQKFVGTPYLEQIRSINTPNDAAKLGRRRNFPLRQDWEAVKDKIMLDAVSCKFQIHLEIRAILLGTGDEEIVENAPNDYYWGCGKDGTGKNQLGVTLMQVRALLRQA